MEISFEDAMRLLEEKAAQLRSGDLSLEESVAAYEECAKYHKLCTEKLAQLRQKIEICRPENDTVEDFEA